jgi:hypothetical protein
MSPAHILGLIFLFALIPFFAGALLLAVLALTDTDYEENNETD